MAEVWTQTFRAALALPVGLALLVGFVCGSIPFGQVFARLKGIDLRKVGSGNIGATNAARALGKKTGVLVMVLDALKAAGPILGVRALFPPSLEREWMEVALGLGAVLGHVFSPWLAFKGGKGVATGFGVFVVLAPVPALIAGAIWVLLYAVTRTSSLGSLAAVLALPLSAWLLGAPRPTLVLALAIAPLILVRHAGNIRRLVKRQETKV